MANRVRTAIYKQERDVQIEDPDPTGFPRSRFPGEGDWDTNSKTFVVQSGGDKQERLPRVSLLGLKRE